MLLGENRGRREHSDLLAVHDRFERRSNSDFSFAETNVAADQSIHRTRTFHIDLRIDDCLHLVRRLPERKGMFEFRLPLSVPRERVPGMHLALCLNGEHLAGIIENRSRSFYFGARPFAVTKRT